MSAPQPRFRRDYRPPSHVIEHVDLEVELRPERTLVRSNLKIFRNPAGPPGPVAELRLDAEGLELLEIAVDGHPIDRAAYSIDDTQLVLHQPRDAFTLQTTVTIRPADNTELSGLYVSNGIFCTQCEAEGFRRITPFLDRPDVMATYTTKIIADAQSCPVLLSNGNRVEAGAIDAERHFVRWEDPTPKPSYLFALVAGNLSCHRGTHTTPSGRTIELEIWVEPVNIARCQFALTALQQAMKWDEDVFGLEYDLGTYMIVAVSDFNMGAMENKGLNIFNTKYVLADAETATDDDYEGIESVIGHEYFHNWTGNRVTCRDWFQLTLKEGLTVFRDQWFSSDMRSAGVKRISDVKVLRAAQFAEDAGPMRHPIRPESYIEMNNFYTVTVYNKGAEVVGMLRTLLGREGFLRGMKLYFSRHDGSAVTCDDFLAAMADANDRKLDRFARWYAQAGTPVVHARGRYDATAQTYEIELEQRDGDGNEPAPDRCWHIPVAMGLLGEDGHDLPLRLADEPAGQNLETTRVLELTQARQTFRFVNVPQKPVPSLLRDFSAPVRVELELERRDLVFATQHDSDAFNRWDAGETVATGALLEVSSRLARGETVALHVDLEAMFAGLLQDLEQDESWLSLALTLPDERVLGQAITPVDVENLHAARQQARRDLGQRFYTDFRRLYLERRDDAYSTQSHAIDRRRLKNTALDYLVASGEREAVVWAKEQFDNATNMSDSQAAVACLVDLDTRETEQALESFYRRWHGVPLVLDKWFTLQALANRDDIVERVRKLTQHADFQLKNPNRVRSLVGVFSQRNQAGFHRADGSGYAVLSDTILAIDAHNPQLASRLTIPLSQCHRHEPKRAAAMRAALQRLLDREGVSKDVYEIAARTLGVVTNG